MDEERLRQAEMFLAEAVFASRAKQSAGAALAAGGSNCGLGASSEVVLDLSPRAQELATLLWPQPLGAPDLERARSLTAAWIELQDALDRKRNHFLKDFRQRHGFDRNAYAPEQLAAFEQGLARINAEVEQRRRECAAQLP
jgi:hypothetical protein